MSIQDEYLSFKNAHGLSTRRFEDRVRLQAFQRGRVPNMLAGRPSFSRGGLFSNDMTISALGFAYYDCRPTEFCKTRCYGLPVAGAFDFNMFRLAVLTSESLKTRDPRFLSVLIPAVRRLKCLKIGHWGDAVPEQVPVIADIMRECPQTTSWWYTRKLEIAMAANEVGLANMRAYLSLDPSSSYPSPSEYPFGVTYLIGDAQRHPDHERIVSDPRLVAIFLLKRGRKVQNPDDPAVLHHPKLCLEKRVSLAGGDTHAICLGCRGRCNYRTSPTCPQPTECSCPHS